MRRESFQNPVTISIRIEKIERDMAQYAGINVSEICRRAIRQELGLCLKESPSIPKSMVDQYFLYLDTRMKQDAELLETVRDYVFQKTQAEEQVTERQQQISAAIKSTMNGTADYYVRRLPNMIQGAISSMSGMIYRKRSRQRTGFRYRMMNSMNILGG